MENLTAEQKRKSVWLEIKDILAGSAFPLMMMLILCASIISYSAYGGELPLKILVLVVGEILLVVAFFIFGKQSGVTAVRRTHLNSKKRELGTDDLKALAHVGEYAVYKGSVIALVSCLPFIIVQLINGIFPNTVCRFLLMYAFGWAYFPFNLAGLSQWLNFIWIIPLCGVHTGAYVYGASRERGKLAKIAEAGEGKNKKK